MVRNRIDSVSFIGNGTNWTRSSFDVSNYIIVRYPISDVYPESAVSQMGTRSTAGCAETAATFTGAMKHAPIRGKFARTRSAWSASSDASARER